MERVIEFAEADHPLLEALCTSRFELDDSSGTLTVYAEGVDTTMGSLTVRFERPRQTLWVGLPWILQVPETVPQGAVLLQARPEGIYKLTNPDGTTIRTLFRGDNTGSATRGFLLVVRADRALYRITTD